jgi:hypothetical protein
VCIAFCARSPSRSARCRRIMRGCGGSKTSTENRLRRIACPPRTTDIIELFHQPAILPILLSMYHDVESSDLHACGCDVMGRNCPILGS